MIIMVSCRFSFKINPLKTVSGCGASLEASVRLRQRPAGAHFSPQGRAGSSIPTAKDSKNRRGTPNPLWILSFIRHQHHHPVDDIKIHHRSAVPALYRYTCINDQTTHYPSKTGLCLLQVASPFQEQRRDSWLA